MPSRSEIIKIIDKWIILTKKYREKNKLQTLWILYDYADGKLSETYYRKNIKTIYTFLENLRIETPEAETMCTFCIEMTKKYGTKPAEVF